MRRLFSSVALFSVSCTTTWVSPAEDDPEAVGAARVPGANCPVPAEAVFYTQSAWSLLADALAADMGPCVDAWVSLPAYSGHKADPRGGGEPAAIRNRDASLHALAEFHWTTWSQQPGSWYDKGVEFRRRMDSAGYDVYDGDAWAINELPSSVRSNATVRQQVMDVVRGLYDGPPGAPHVQGVVWTVGMGHATTNFSVYEPNLQNWLQDSSFWGQMNLYVRWWGQEVYADPYKICVPGQNVGSRSTQINEFGEHVAHYAEVGPSTADTAESYLGRAYTPTMNAVWQSNGNGYGNTVIPLDQMEHFVSHEVYAARAWSGTHAYPDGRLGFAWGRVGGASDADLRTLAARLASAIHYAYDEGGGSAAQACSPTGAYTWCQCSLQGAVYNDGWETFNVW